MKINNAGYVLGTFSAKKGQSGLPRPRVENLNIINGFGIKDDKFAGTNENKAVMIVGKIAYEIAQEYDISLEDGSLGENVLIDFNPHDYKIGTILKIGDTVLQSTENCTICNHLSVFSKKLPYIVKHCRGVYFKVLEGGNISKGSSIEILKEYKSNKQFAC